MTYLSALFSTLWQHFSISLGFGLVPVLMIALICAVLACLTWRRELILFAFSFGVLGAATGLLTGNSREPVVAAVLPAILALIGAVIVYAFPKVQPSFLGVTQSKADAHPEYKRDVIIVSILALMVSASMGASFGASIREANEAAAFARTREDYLFQNVEVPFMIDKLKNDLANQRAGSAN